jgi:hypothetical protein
MRGDIYALRLWSCKSRGLLLLCILRAACARRDVRHGSFSEACSRLGGCQGSLAGERGAAASEAG